MAFYPFYSTGSVFGGTCLWQFGGGLIPGTIDNFGGNPTSAWGSLFSSLFQTGRESAEEFITNFRRALPNNPCAVSPSGMASKLAQTTAKVE